jgi:outer membrane protein OmpA-like peptidoglycan-associated protein
MNKVSLLTLVLVVALPGCGGSKNQSTQSSKKSSVAKHMNFDDSTIVEENYGDGNEYTDEDDNAIEFNFDEEDEDNDMSLDDLEDMDVMEEEQEDVEGDNDQAFRWIDAQTDDEFKTLYFTFNHYGIRADQKASVEYDVEQVKQLLAESGTTAQPTVVIEGHACQEGTPAYNVALSEKRAKIVADHFVAAGIPSSSIKVVGRGQECPAVINGKPVNGSREARWPNRRVEVRVIYT